MRKKQCKNIWEVMDQLQSGSTFSQVGFGSTEVYGRDRIIPITKNPVSGFSGFGVGSAEIFKRDGITPMAKLERAIISIGVNNQCSLGCDHCVAAGTDKKPDRYQEVIESFHSLCPELLEKITYASFASLEPLKTPERVGELAEFFHQSGIKTALMTNAVNLGPEVQEMLSGKIDYLDPSIDGLCKTCKPARVNGGYSTAWENIKMAVENGFAKKTRVIVTVREENVEEVEALLKFFQDELGENPDFGCTLWFYLGKKLLSEDLFLKTIKCAITSRYKGLHIAIPGEYNRYLSRLIEKGASDWRYCSVTGVPSFLLAGVPVFLLGSATGACSLFRIEPDGELFIGCEHLHQHHSMNLIGSANKCLSEVFSSLFY